MILKIKMLFLLCLFVFLYGYQFDTKLDLNGDNFVYLANAKNIAENFTYTNIDGTVSYWFPPGYPVFLGLQSLLIDSVNFYKFVNGILILFSALLIYHIRKDNTSFGAAIVFLLHPDVMRNATTIMSEPLFIFISLVTILLVEKNYIIAAFLAGISMYIRGVGLALIGALFLYHLFQKKWINAAISLVVSVITYLPWIIRNKIQGAPDRFVHSLYSDNIWRENKYVEGLGGILEKVFNNLFEYSNAYLNLIVKYHTETQSFSFIGLAIVIAVLFGLYKISKVGLLYFICTMGILLLFHGGNGARYLLPLIPFIFLGVFSTINEMVKVIDYEEYINYVYSIFIASLFLLFSPFIKNNHITAESNLHPIYQNYINVAKNASTLAGSPIVYTRKPEIFSYYSGLVSYRYPYTKSKDKFLKSIKEEGITHIHIDQLPYSSRNLYLIPFIQKTKECYSVSFKLDENYFLEIDKKCLLLQ